MDTKADPGFDEWKPQVGLLPLSRIARLWRERQFVVIRPRPAENSNTKLLDTYLGELHDGFDNFGVDIDETYQLQIGGKPGPGLTGLVARGRARQQAVIMGSQRPAWVPRFIFSEANFIASMSLNLEDDRDRVYEFTGKQEVLVKLPPRSWFFYDVAADRLKRYAPVLITP